jgi:hypothetical protein
MLCLLGLWVPAQMPVRMCRLTPRSELVFEEDQQFLHAAGELVGFGDDQGVARPSATPRWLSVS